MTFCAPSIEVEFLAHSTAWVESTAARARGCSYLDPMRTRAATSVTSDVPVRFSTLHHDAYTLSSE